MLKNPIEEKVNRWAISDGEYFRDINQQIIHLEKRLFNEYLPCQSPNPSFFFRLKRWLENLTSEEDQKIFFRLIPFIFYIGSEEFNSLYRSSYNIEVAKWLIEKTSIKFNDDEANRKLRDASLNTWFCPFTDSFKINDFIKINNVPSKYNLRPDWHSLTELGSLESIQLYLQANNISRIVLLEDFVGSGSQVHDKLVEIASLLDCIEILFISLLTCPQGVTTLNNIQLKCSNLTVRHIVEIKKEAFIAKNKEAGEEPLFTETRELIIRIYPQTTNNNTSPIDKPYHPLGFREIGGLVVMNSNTPDNTIPVIHWPSATWHPLFKRITRL